MKVEFEWKDPNLVLSQVQKMLVERGERIARVPERALRRGTFELLKLVQAEVPKLTSTLVRSITATVNRISADMIEGRVGTWLVYARYLEEGTGIYGPKKKPILITARNKKGLFWGAHDAEGRAIVRRSVLSPGMKPRAPFAKAMANFLPRYQQIILEELAREGAK
jgi:hypothetical protein